jgi:hypothetical protein
MADDGKDIRGSQRSIATSTAFFTFFNQQMMICCGTSAEKVLLHHTEGFYTSVVDGFVQNGT